ncbi:MAG: TonB family protein [Rhodocyclaceae bacterium]|jgi:protein TonB|nr:TonB family protein [Rhodocyclaceae bacterium]MBK6908340.1 TonB family protein [Rhodocyclaceae bacterium]
MARFNVQLDSRRAFKVALGVSLALHAVLLSIHFKLPETLGQASEKALDVILVNSKHKTKPTQAQAKAQANLDGGGNVAEDRRAKTPLPPSERSTEGNELVEAQRKVAQLEAQQQQILTQTKSSAALPLANQAAMPQPEPVRSGVDLASSALAMIKLEAEIARQMEEYNQKPRRKFIGARTQEYRFAQYVEDWRHKIERVGNLNYPDAARGKHYGSLVLTVVIKANGDLDRVEINRSSGKSVLDEAAMRIVRLAAPYAAFPNAIRTDTDLLEITRVWSFTQTDQLKSE